LASIYSEVPEAFAGSMFEGETSAEDLKRLYNRDTNVPVFVGAPGVRNLNLDSLPPRSAQVKSEWFRIVRAHPDIYLKTRMRRFTRLLGIGPYVHYPFQGAMYPNQYGFQHWDTGLYRALRAYQYATSQSALFLGWVWVLGLMLVTGVAFAMRQRAPLAFWVGASGLTYLAAYWLIAPSADFRYLYWCLLALFAAIALMLPRRAT
jgi:hypothetical protein